MGSKYFIFGNKSVPKNQNESLILMGKIILHYLVTKFTIKYYIMVYIV